MARQCAASYLRKKGVPGEGMAEPRSLLAEDEHALEAPRRPFCRSVPNNSHEQQTAPQPQWTTGSKLTPS